MKQLILTIFTAILITSCTTSGSSNYAKRKSPDVETFMHQAAYPLKTVPAHYPRKAQISNTEGWVFFEFNLSESGKVKHLNVIDSHPKGIFEEVASKAISKWTFKPIKGVSSYKYVMEFQLRGY